ncbi:Na(+)-translocating NADH-quinone reductase subunit C [bacterium]|nr:Na(+)-translocating NADH-quinone reductase subunit C [bacterium]
MENDSVKKTLIVATLLCVVCSVLVSTAAVKLKPLQDKNKALSTKANILRAAGLMEEGADVEELYKKIQVRYVNLATGEFDDSVDPVKFNRKKALKDLSLSVEIPAELDIAKIKRRVKIVPIYLVRESDQLKTIILPIHGKGLWSTMYAFLALEGDGDTVRGYAFYDHGETPGLGGEVDNPLWRGQWVGKKIYDQDFKLAVDIVKGKVNRDKPLAIHQVDGLSGATLTTIGVRNLTRYWLGDHGFGKFLSNIRERRATNG